MTLNGPTNEIDVLGLDLLENIERIGRISGQVAKPLAVIAAALQMLNQLDECRKGLEVRHPECVKTAADLEIWKDSYRDAYKRKAIKCRAAAVSILALLASRGNFKVFLAAVPVAQAVNTLNEWDVNNLTDEELDEKAGLYPLPAVDGRCCNGWRDHFDPANDPFDSNATWWNPYHGAYEYHAEGAPMDPNWRPTGFPSP